MELLHFARDKSVCFVLAATLNLQTDASSTEVSGVEQTVAFSVQADTMIAFDQNSMPPGAFGNGLEQSTPHGNLDFLTIRGGDPFDPNSLTAKPLIRFDLGSSPTIDPDLPYFLEVTTDTNDNSNDTFRIYSITDAPTRSFNEATFTWDYAEANAPNASASFDDYLAAGPEVGIFFAPFPGAAGVKLQTPILGSQINTYVDGTTLATFGFASTDVNRMEIRSKEKIGGGDQARLITYSQENSDGGGSLNGSGTWTGGVPVADTLYRVINGDTVFVDGVGTFAGRGVVVDNGTLDFTASDVDFQIVVLNAAGNLAHSAGGNLSIGNPSSARNGAGLILNRDLTYTAAAGEDLTINLPLRSQSQQSFTFQGGLGSDLTLRYPQGHRGSIFFDGSAREVVITEDEGIGGTLVMNSNALAVDPNSEGNTLAFEGEDSELEIGVGTVIFNQPGAIDHRTDTFKSDRLQGVAFLEVDAALTVNLTETAVTNSGGGTGNGERFFRITRALSGAGDISVEGTVTPPMGSGITNNAFQIGVTDGDDTDIHSVDYAGTITTSNYATVQPRVSTPKAKIVVNQDGILATGHRLNPEASIQIGEINLLPGGELNVGYLAAQELVIDEEHQLQELRLTTLAGRSGDLTLAAGSTTRMQISGDPNTTDFDTILVEGTATLGGTLEILLNHDIPNSLGASPDPQYYPPNLGDRWNIITAIPSPADFDGSGTVGSGDLAQWEGDYGVNADSDADGDGDSDGADFLAWQRVLGQTGGIISGTFDNFVVDDFFGDLAAHGLAMQVNYLGSSVVQIEVVSASPIESPEPTTAVLSLFSIIFSGLQGRRWIAAEKR